MPSSKKLRGKQRQQKQQTKTKRQLDPHFRELSPEFSPVLRDWIKRECSDELIYTTEKGLAALEAYQQKKNARYAKIYAADEAILVSACAASDFFIIFEVLLHCLEYPLNRILYRHLLSADDLGRTPIHWLMVIKAPRVWPNLDANAVAPSFMRQMGLDMKEMEATACGDGNVFFANRATILSNFGGDQTLMVPDNDCNLPLHLAAICYARKPRSCCLGAYGVQQSCV
jgi:hypothetical protein